MAALKKLAPRKPSRLLRHKGLHGTLRANLDIGELEGEVLLLSTPVRYQGKTVAQATKAFERAVDAYLAECKRLNREPGGMTGKSFLVRLKPPLHLALIARSGDEGVSMAHIINQALEEYLGI